MNFAILRREIIIAVIHVIASNRHYIIECIN